LKKGIRIISFASGPIGGKKALIVGVISRENTIEGILSGSVETDGFDSAKKIISLIKKSRFREQIKIVALNGIAIAGLNVVDVYKIKKDLKIGFIILTRKKPRSTLLIEALGRSLGKNLNKKIDIVNLVSEEKIHSISGLFLQSNIEIDRTMADYAFEGLRISHLIARGVYTGESKGRL
jgi:endonuclease V-like protein UPF0215 family